MFSWWWWCCWSVESRAYYESTSADDPEGYTSTTESWQDSTKSCSFDGEEYSSTAANPMDADFGTVLSGVFDIRSQLDGFYNEDVYFSNPVDFLQNLSDHNTLEAIRRNHIVLTTAEHEPERLLRRAARDDVVAIDQRVPGADEETRR